MRFTPARILISLRIGKGAASPLFGLVDDCDPEVRLVAARALRAIGPQAKGAAGAIAVLLDDDDAYVRMTAALTLGGLGEQSVAALHKAQRDHEPQVIKIAGYALADLGPAAEALVRQFEHKGGYYIPVALGAIDPGAQAAIPSLEKAGNKEYWSAAINAALFRIRGEREDLNATVAILREPGDRYGREHAAKELDRLGAVAAPVADDVRAFLKEQGDEWTDNNKDVAGLLNRYFDKVKASE